MPITSEAASAPLTKNRATRTMTTNEVTPEIGNCSSMVKSATSACRRSRRGRGAAELEVDRRAAEDGEQAKLTPLGMSSTPTTNSRTVRPLEMRAMKVPTKGAHEIHHAQ